MKTATGIFLFIFFALIRICAQNERHDLIVFVGQKIDIKPVSEKLGPTMYDTIVNSTDTACHVTSFSFDFYNKYVAKYRVLQMIKGSLRKDTIEFVVFSHIGEPSFSKFETLLVLVYEKDGQYYQEHRIYYDLYRTQNNRWAGSYSPSDYNRTQDNITVRAEKIKFKKQLSAPLDSSSEEWVKTRYPEPYYKIKDGKAIAVYGNYAEDIFKLLQQGVLKARGLH